MTEPVAGSWDAIRRARVGLMMSHPYLANAVARLPLVDATGRPWCPTCATDGYAIYANSEFTSTLNLGELMFVLAHELIHCMVGHLDRRGDRDGFVWNVAADYATNALLASHGFRPLGSALLDPRLARLSAEEIYERLMSSGGGSGMSALKVRTADGSTAKLHRDPLTEGEAARDIWLDRHLPPDGTDPGELRPSGFPTALERRILRRALIQAAASAAGSTAGFWQSALGPATVSPLAWKSLLAQFMAGLRRTDYRMFPPNRKHIHRGVYMPSVGVPGPTHIVVAVDTSGSMPDRLLSEIFAQIDHLRTAAECSITVLQFDTIIQAKHLIEPWDTFSTATLAGGAAVGRGGTDLRAPFLHLDTIRSDGPAQLDALIVLTDGDGPSPKVAPAYPVLWLIAPEGKNSCPFGMVVELPGN